MLSFLPATKRPVTGAAYSKARHKITHTAFIELNQKAVVNLTYQNEHRRYQGYRILAVDGSKIRLPEMDELKDVFGTLSYANQGTVKGEHVAALASVLYDVLNNIAVDARLERCDLSEISVAKKHFPFLQPKDLAMLDRGYCAYEIMASISATGADFLIRCPQNTFLPARQLFTDGGPDSIVVTLKSPQKQAASVLKVRFVRVRLKTGETEVLATSLLNKKAFPTSSFKELYWHRWGIETFYGILKNRLALENFTGLSEEAVRQDFFATVFLSGLEAILTEDVDTELKQKSTRYEQQVNRAVAFHAIKLRAFELLLGNDDAEETMMSLTKLFLTNPTLIRPDKQPERKLGLVSRTVNFLRYKRKNVF